MELGLKDILIQRNMDNGQERKEEEKRASREYEQPLGGEPSGDPS